MIPVRNPSHTAEIAPRVTAGKGRLFKYDAFISYSHFDKALAGGLQRGLHRVGRRFGQLRALRVFRDATDLSAGPALLAGLHRELDGSRFLISVLSPGAADSEWVNAELCHWIERRGTSTLLLVLADGEVRWEARRGAFDPVLSTAVPPVLATPGVFDGEPLYVDLTWATTKGDFDPRSPLFRDRVAQLAAPIHGLSKEALESDDRRELRRFHRYRTAAIVGLAVLATAATIAGFIASRQRDEARHQTRVARAGELAALSAATPNPLEAAVLAVESAVPTGRPLIAADEAYTVATQRMAALGALPIGSFAGDGLNTSAAWSPAGDVVAVGGSDDRIRLWNPSTGRPTGVVLTGQQGAIVVLAWSPDGKRLASRSTKGDVVAWTPLDSTTPRRVWAPEFEDPYVSGAGVLSWAPDNHRLVLGTNQGLAFWDADSATLEIHDDLNGLESVVWSHAGDRLAIGGYTTEVVNDSTLTPIWNADADPDLVGASTWNAIWSPDDREIAMLVSDGTVRVVDSASGAVRATIDAGSPPTELTWSPDGRLLATVDAGGEAALWDRSTLKAHGSSLTPVAGAVRSLSWSPDADHFVTLSAYDNTSARGVTLWEPSTTPKLGRPLIPEPVTMFRWSPTGDAFTVNGGEGMLALYSTADGTLDEALWNRPPGYDWKWSPDGTMLAFTSSDGGVVWNLAEHRAAWTWTDAVEGYDGIEWRHDGSLAVSSPAGMSIVDGRTGKVLRRAGTVGGGPGIWSPDDRRFAVFDGREIRLVNASNFAEQAALDTSALIGDLIGGVDRMVWSPDGSVLVVQYVDRLLILDGRTLQPVDGGAIKLAGDFGHDELYDWSTSGELAIATGEIVQVWSSASRHVERVLTGQGGRITSIAWSPDGRWVAAVGTDELVHFWSPERDSPLAAVIDLSDGNVHTVDNSFGEPRIAWHPNGRWLMVSGYDGIARLWTTTGLEQTCARARRGVDLDRLRERIGSQVALRCKGSPEDWPSLVPIVPSPS